MLCGRFLHSEIEPIANGKKTQDPNSLYVALIRRHLSIQTQILVSYMSSFMRNRHRHRFTLIRI